MGRLAKPLDCDYDADARARCFLGVRHECDLCGGAELIFDFNVIIHFVGRNSNGAKVGELTPLRWHLNIHLMQHAPHAACWNLKVVGT